MTTTGCITHPANMRMVLVRDEYVRVCAGFAHKECAAALLNMFERWHDYKVAMATEARRKRRDIDPTPIKDDLWVYMSRDDMREELFKMFGANMIVTSVAYLVKRGFIFERFNPDAAWDRTKQYLFHVKRVQLAIDRVARGAATARMNIEAVQRQQRPLFRIKQCTVYQQTMQRPILNNRVFRIKQALPQTSTQLSTQREKEAPPAPSEPQSDAPLHLHQRRSLDELMAAGRNKPKLAGQAGKVKHPELIPQMIEAIYTAFGYERDTTTDDAADSIASAAYELSNTPTALPVEIVAHAVKEMERMEWKGVNASTIVKHLPTFMKSYKAAQKTSVNQQQRVNETAQKAASVLTAKSATTEDERERLRAQVRKQGVA